MTRVLQTIMFHKSKIVSADILHRKAKLVQQNCQLFSGPWAGRFEKE